MELILHRCRPLHRNRGRQRGVHPAHPGRVRTHRVGIEMRDLRAGVHARVGAPRPADADRVVRDHRQRPLQMILDSIARWLRLPAVERGAVISDADRDAHCCHSWFREDTTRARRVAGRACARRRAARAPETRIGAGGADFGCNGLALNQALRAWSSPAVSERRHPLWPPRSGVLARRPCRPSRRTPWQGRAS